MPVSNKRSSMTLYTDPYDAYSHQVRIVLAEKGVNYDTVDLDPETLPQEVAELTPYGRLPILVDRDLVLYEPRIIMEYMDERFPHPPLLPVYPVQRAKFRLMMERIDRDWYGLAAKIEGDLKDGKKHRKELLESIIGMTPVFEEMPFFFSETFSLVDCVIAPLFWRLPIWDIAIPSKAKAVLRYQERIFELDAFQKSLTEQEKEMRV